MVFALPFLGQDLYKFLFADQPLSGQPTAKGGLPAPQIRRLESAIR